MQAKKFTLFIVLVAVLALTISAANPFSEDEVVTITWWGTERG